MKKLILLFCLFAFMFQTMKAENHRLYAVFCWEASGATPVLIQATTGAGSTWTGFKFKENCLRDSDGNEIKFTNFLPALGYIESIGWTIPEKEDQILKNIDKVINGKANFLIYKEVSEDEWLQWIDDGKMKKK